MSPNPFWNTYTEYLKTAQQQSSSCSYNLWQAPVAYWQTVSSIMGLRTTTAQTLQQAWVECCTTLAICKTPAQVTQCLNTYQQQATLCCTDLNTQTHKYRAELWHTWQVLGQRCSLQPSPTSWMNTAPQTPTYSQTSSAKPSSTPQSAPYSAPAASSATPTPTYLKGWFIAGTPQKSVSSTPYTAPMAAAVTQSVANKTIEPMKATQPETPKEAPKAQPQRIEAAPQQNTQESLPMAVGQSYSATPTVSSTADSVMRIGNAAASASAAATRRSVLARHTTRKSRLTRR